MTGQAWGATAVVVVALFAYGAVCYTNGQSNKDAEWSGKWKDQVAKLDKQKIEAVEAALVAERAARAKSLEASKDAQNQNAKVDAGVVDNGVAADRLRDAATKLAGSGANMPSAATLADRSAAATRAAMVLSELLDRSIQVNRELAAAYDRARIAGLACQKINAQ